jgi:branched-chain amino acid transport system substrate-binding protein
MGRDGQRMSMTGPLGPWVATLSLAVAIVVTACGGSSTGGSGGSNGGVSEVKIGVPLSLTGAGAFAGSQMKKAMDLAFSDENQALKLKGLSLSPVYADDRSDQPTGIDVTNQLALQDQVSAIVGYTASNICQAALPIANKDKVPTINSDCVVSNVVPIGPYIYRVAEPLDPALSLLAAKFASAQRLHTVAGIYLQQNPSTVETEKVFMNAFQKSGVKIGPEEAVQSQSASNFSSQLTRIAAAKPDALVVAVLGGQAGQVMLQARQVGLTVPFLGEQNVGSFAVVQVAAQAAVGTYFATYWNPTGGPAVNKKFISEFRARYKADPDTFAANGYAGVQLISAAVAKAGRPGSGGVIAYREKLRSALNSLGRIQSIYGDGTLEMVGRAGISGGVLVELKAGNPPVPTVFGTVAASDVSDGIKKLA